MPSIATEWSVLISTVLYPLVALGYTALTGYDARRFGIALAILVGVRLLSALTDYVSDVLTWRAFGKRAFVEGAMKWLHANRFPMRKDEDSTFPAYLIDIQEGFGYSDSVKSRAEVLAHGLLYAETLLPRSKARRVWGAWNAALDMYSPKRTASG